MNLVSSCFRWLLQAVSFCVFVAVLGVGIHYAYRYLPHPRATAPEISETSGSETAPIVRTASDATKGS
jgi:hypothetical protein